MKNNWRIVAAIVLIIIAIVVFVFTIVMPYLEAQNAEKELNNGINQFEEYLDKVDGSMAQGEIVTVPQIPVATENTSPTEPTTSTYDSDALMQYIALRVAVDAHNKEIFENNQEGLLTKADCADIVLDVSEYGLPDGVFGVVSIPSIDVQMPLRLAASDKNLDKGFAQISYTSIPVGGPNTHSVIAAHRGWKGADYLKYVDKVAVGDMVYVQNPWETLEYVVTEIVIIKPWESEYLTIQPGKDLLTVCTCHPYGNGYNRYLLVCERASSSEN